MSSESRKLTKQDLRKINLRWQIAGQWGWNYERMQGLPYCYTMIPALKKWYKDEEELKKSLKMHLQFYNTEPDMSHLIIGADLAIEEEQGIEGKDAVSAIKTGLMGPFAGVGDTIFGVISGTIFGSIAAYMAMEGNSLGIWIWLIWLVARWFFRWWFINLGYKQGTKLVATMSGKIKDITEGATILGLTVIGALIPTVVKAKVPFVFQSGDVQMNLQDILNQIMPALIPVCLVGVTYWLLARKGMNSTKAIFLLLLVGIILFNLKVLG